MFMMLSMTAGQKRKSKLLIIWLIQVILNTTQIKQEQETSVCKYRTFFPSPTFCK